MASSNHIETIAIIGAGGQVGGVIAKALITQGKHKLTAITRPDSSSRMPEGLHEVRKADYSDHAALVQALKGQQVLIITMAATVPKETQMKLIDAAKEAGVTYIMPNEYGVAIDNEQFAKDIMIGAGSLAVRRHIEKIGLKWIGLSCGFWCV